MLPCLGLVKLKNTRKYCVFSYHFIFVFLFHILNISPNVVLIFLIVIFFISLYAVNIFIKDLENKDPKEVVIDEFIGQSIPICLYEIAHEGIKETNVILTYYFVMFVVFRIFDIIKPFPASYYEKNFKSSLGVIMDDVCAGLYVVAVLVLYGYYFVKKLSQKIIKLLKKRDLNCLLLSLAQVGCFQVRLLHCKDPQNICNGFGHLFK